MSYFGDCFNALVSLSTAKLDTNIGIAAVGLGIAWNSVDFSPQNGHFITEDVESEDALLSTDVNLPCLSVYLDGAENQTYMMGQSFSGPAYFCMDIHLGSEQNDQLYLMNLRMAVAEGMYRTFDSMDMGIISTWVSFGVAYSRGLKLKISPSTLFSANQYQDYQGMDMWLCKMAFQARFNLIRI